MPIERIRNTVDELLSRAETELHSGAETELLSATQENVAELAALDRKITANIRRHRSAIISEFYAEADRLKQELHRRCAVALMGDVVADRVMEHFLDFIRGFQRWHAVPTWAPAYSDERHGEAEIGLRLLQIIAKRLVSDLDVILAHEGEQRARQQREAELARQRQDELDDAAYVSAKDVLHPATIPDFKALHKILRENPWIQHKKPGDNRLMVHAGDLTRCLAQKRREEERASAAAEDHLDELARLKEQERRRA